MATPKLSVIHKRDQERLDSVELLEEFLQRARAGEYAEVMVVAISADDREITFGASGGLSRTEQVGSLECLKHRILLGGE